MTVELFLNLVWLSIAVSALSSFAMWAAAQPSDGRSRRKRVHVAIALACGLALLFPIISVTDDLHSDAVALEEWSSARRTTLILNQHALAVPMGTLAEQIARHLAACVAPLLVIDLPPADPASFTSPPGLRAPPRS
ncbi:MAG: hypothetical protein NVSMB68_00100 [Thermoanaerobaculia bacterium]